MLYGLLKMFPNEKTLAKSTAPAKQRVHLYVLTFTPSDMNAELNRRVVELKADYFKGYIFYNVH